MNYEQLIEELREEMLQLVNTKCDALLQMYRSGEMHTDKRDTIRESSLIAVSLAELKGKRPLAVQFAPGEWIETPTWRKRWHKGFCRPVMNSQISMKDLWKCVEK